MTLDAGLLADLGAILGDRLSTAAAVREHHGREESWHPPMPPEAVAFARSTAEVVAVVKACAQRRVPIIPFGTGTSLEGHIAALRGGVCLDLSQMDRIVAVNAADMDVIVEPGVTRKRLNEHLRDSGLFFPVDPGADASLGGMASTRASGTNAVRYGTMRENVVSLEVVLADGRLIRTGRRARKSAAGYDLTRLFVGAEGTLGVITQLTLKLYGIPEAISAAVVPFADFAQAVDTVIEVIQSAIPVARIELLDEVQIRACNLYSKLDYAVQPTLFLEFHGTAAGVDEQVRSVAAIAQAHGGGPFQWATSQEERTRLWTARHNAAYASMALRPGCRAWATDVCVPISRLAECIGAARAEAKDSPLTTMIVGHVGDGNFHMAMLVDPAAPAEIAEAKRLNDRIVGLALALDGTCTGEHGVGYGKIPYLEAEHGEAIEVMRTLKRALDPADIMNPGKVVRLD